MESFTILVPMILFGWIPVTVLAFWLLKPHHAVIFSILGGWLFLPMAAYDLPGFPEYNKEVAISLGLILGSFLSERRRNIAFQLKIYDLPMLVWCCCPLITSMLNHLGLYDGLSSVLTNVFVYGVPYFIGRIFFNTVEALQDLCIGIIIGGIIYLPLCLYEIRMSPVLHQTLYGFFQHSFTQHIRYGGYRPIVFMQHGLMVSLWMATTTTVTFWYWRNRVSAGKTLHGFELLFVFLGLAATTILCKSANGWAILVLGLGCYVLYTKFRAIRFFELLILFIPLYFFIRISGLISTQDIASVAGVFFDPARVSSLTDRLLQEDLVRAEILKRPLFGWGKFGRGLPVDNITGRVILYVRDSLWLITFQTFGLLGLSSLYVSILSGPWLVLRNSKKIINAHSTFVLTLILSLSLVVIFYGIDSLVNAMHSTLYIMISGALLSFTIEIYQNNESEEILKAGKS